MQVSTAPQRNSQSNSLLLLPESKKTDTSNLDDLESDTRNITLSLSSSTETGDEDLVVLVGLHNISRQTLEKSNGN